MTGTVNVSKLKCADGSVIGVLELDNPAALNALSYVMIEQLYKQLNEWQMDDSIVAVFLHAKGEKAFCAGGDIQAIYRALENKEEDFDSAFSAMETFFDLEYRCDHLIHTYPKPIIAWGHGYLMGGGVGLFMGASHRVAETTTRFAMPEIKIGLYPDVGATYFLNQLPKHLALFLGLTACQINATDMKALGLSRWVAPPEGKQQLIEHLSNVNWLSQPNIHDKLSSILNALEAKELGEGLLMPHAGLIEQLCSGDLDSIVRAISSADVDNKWFVNAQKALNYGSPLSINITYQQLTQYQNLSLKACFDMEFNLTLRCGLEGDFREGVRALIIDKTNQPTWQHRTVSDVAPQALERFFAPIDSLEYPLTVSPVATAAL
ncbi:enoyl-CoA hydratase/isomerase family protein [Vibrio parahaemolyticus]|uniref:enoyl-CoA hydratase/isomerase family protein n=1 Tax=Vibrio parahaemolyticus TaxID=670 RepID=UPI000991BFBB|nr:enoyl-CoA hydratase/isomerase family protein [Vibrio parahaemolyticus]OOQ70800.1 enoyl-CoA hydratase [Vibrio parahaemolyticus]PMT76331.1 enoyl-CoA hydratase/isomerase family protein [Vibrio parahaemolyticus]PMT80666.1 enoyl-CoA hydratase/isomerase family protein [Vibrio parahaemolyticus]